MASYRSNISEQIKDLVDLRVAIEHYGVHFNRRGFAICPFHDEKTASLSIKGQRWKCFGCDAGGSIIDFVMRLFNISFPQAVVRLNADFGLGFTSEKANPQQLERLKKEKQEKDYERELYEAEYREKSDAYRRLWQAKQTRAPKTIEDVDPLYVEACHVLPILDYWFSIHCYTAR